MNPQAYENRRRRLRGALRKKNIRHFLVTSLPNIRYLSGFTGSNAALWVSPDDAVFFTDGRYTEQSSREVIGCRLEIVEQAPFLARVAKTVRTAKPRSLAFEGYGLSVSSGIRLENYLGGKTRLRPVDDLVENLRQVKDRWEIRAIRRAAKIVDLAFDEFIRTLRTGETEREAQWRLRTILRAHGSEGDPFDFIVLFGARASLPHGKPGKAKLRKGNWVLMDFGAIVDGYCSDFTRTVVKGKATDEMREVYEVVREAQAAAVREARPRVTGRTVDAAARDVITEAGYGKEFSHGLGHGVGLEIHEGPRLARTVSRRLGSGMVVTIEPGVYREGWGGIRIEDTVLITKKGSSRLTKATRELLEV
jgi:Xaa-Pro aminopeptidase